METINTTVVTLLSVLMLESFLLGVMIMAGWKICAKGEFKPFFGGVFVYLAFVTCMKGIFDLLFALTGVQNHIALAVYDAVAWAALLPLARYLGFTVLHRDRAEGTNAVSFGLGMGGAELIMLFGFSAITYYSYGVAFSDPATMGQLGQMAAGDAEMINQVKTYLQNLTVTECVWTIVECVARLALQVALAVLTFAAARRKAEQNLLWISAGLQFVALLPLALSQSGGGLPLWCAESVLLVTTIGSAVYAYFVYQTLPKPKSYEANFRHL